MSGDYRHATLAMNCLLARLGPSGASQSPSGIPSRTPSPRSAIEGVPLPWSPIPPQPPSPYPKSPVPMKEPLYLSDYKEEEASTSRSYGQGKKRGTKLSSKKK
ncbi:hypothetical protein BDZ89DRAFT_1069281 [Hymenopellis radicata]|nr:hypothetical protein BDZ89DRAFT_1069281 [Hymenopellis radicata]